MENVKTIRIRGARQNNLKSINLDIPHRQWLTICGRSGSGKSSLAVQTIYAEGQRRYVESFSPFTRQFLDQAEKPQADAIESVPAAVFVNTTQTKFGRRTTIASVAGILPFVQLLFARIATIVCPNCNLPVEADHPQGTTDRLGELPDGVRFMIGFDVSDWWGIERQYFNESWGQLRNQFGSWVLHGWYPGRKPSKLLPIAFYRLCLPILIAWWLSTGWLPANLQDREFGNRLSQRCDWGMAVVLFGFRRNNRDLRVQQ